MKPVKLAISALFALLFLLLLLSGTVYAADDFEIKSDAEVEQAVVRAQVICSYAMQTRDPRGSPLRADKTQYFNSFFVGHVPVGGAYRETLIAPAHGLICEHTLPEIFSEINLELYDANSFEGVLSAIAVWHWNAERGPGKVAKLLYTTDPHDPVDIGIFIVELPRGIPHRHLPIGSSAWYAVGSKVVMRGFMEPQNLGTSIFRYKEAEVEEKGKNSMRISTQFYPGMSGSPLTIKHKGKWYAIGVMVRFVFDRRFGFWDASWATIIPENF